MSDHGVRTHLRYPKFCLPMWKQIHKGSLVTKQRILQIKVFFFKYIVGKTREEVYSGWRNLSYGPQCFLIAFSAFGWWKTVSVLFVFKTVYQDVWSDTQVGKGWLVRRQTHCNWAADLWAADLQHPTAPHPWSSKQPIGFHKHSFFPGILVHQNLGL